MPLAATIPRLFHFVSDRKLLFASFAYCPWASPRTVLRSPLRPVAFRFASCYPSQMENDSSPIFSRAASTWKRRPFRRYVSTLLHSSPFIAEPKLFLPPCLDVSLYPGDLTFRPAKRPSLAPHPSLSTGNCFLIGTRI